jgi:hypothetical protein
MPLANCLNMCPTIGTASVETFRKLTLADKPNIDRLLDSLQSETSDLTFTNLWMWQYSYGLQVFYHPSLDFWFLWCSPPNWNKFFLPPIGDWSNPEKVKAALKFMEEWAAAEKFSFMMRRTPKRLVEALQKAEPTLKVQDDRNTADYVYRSDELILLAGRKFHGKRNHLNQFLRKYQWEYLPMDTKLARECLNLEREWFNLKHGNLEELSEEDQAMAMLLGNFEALKVTGGIVKLDGNIAALAVGEKLNVHTAVIHIEKANTEFDGMYPAINQQFAANCWSAYEFINREEDMGLEGLRKAKLSYNPVLMVDKYSVSR